MHMSRYHIIEPEIFAPDIRRPRRRAAAQRRGGAKTRETRIILLRGAPAAYSCRASGTNVDAIYEMPDAQDCVRSEPRPFSTSAGSVIFILMSIQREPKIFRDTAAGAHSARRTKRQRRCAKRTIFCQYARWRRSRLLQHARAARSVRGKENAQNQPQRSV